MGHESGSDHLEEPKATVASYPASSKKSAWDQPIAITLMSARLIGTLCPTAKTCQSAGALDEAVLLVSREEAQFFFRS